MPSYKLEWRQFLGDGEDPAFLHRLMRAGSAAEVGRTAAALGDRAWRREFRVARGDRVVFTDLHRIEDWVISCDDLPSPAADHVWRSDLGRDLAADRFLHAVTGAAVPAVAAGVLPSDAADALVRFARRSLLRPRL